MAFENKQFLDYAGLEALVGKIKAADTAINNKIGAVEEGKTVVEMIQSAEYNDTEIKADVQEAANAASTAQGTANEALRKVNDFMNAAELGEAAVDTLKEIQDYITNEGEAAAEMTKNIAANAKAIEDLDAKATKAIEDLDATVASADVESGKGVKATVVQTNGALTSVALEGNFDNAYDAKGSANDAYEAMKSISLDSIDALFN